MSAETRRLVQFSVGLCVLVAALMSFAQWQHELFAAASHRVRFKAALLERQRALDYVVIGTSRLNDGIDPGQVSAFLEAQQVKPALRGFNAAVPSSSLETMRFLSAHVTGAPVVLLEASPQQLAREDDATLHDDEVTGAERLALIRYRRALVVDNLLRFIALAFPQAFDGSEFFRTKWLSERAQVKWSDISPDVPQVVCPDAAEATPNEAAPFAVAAAAVRSHGGRVLIVVPPSSRGKRDEECSEVTRAEWKKVAAQAHAPVLSFACNEWSAESFHDPLHFSAVGRARFSASMGVVLNRNVSAYCEAK